MGRACNLQPESGFPGSPDPEFQQNQRAPLARRAVLLRHETGPPAGDHLDLLLDTHPSPDSPQPDQIGKPFEADPDDRRLLTLRLPERARSSILGLPGDMQWVTAEILPRHRLRYLVYQGPVGGDRGTVTRLAAGHWWPRPQVQRRQDPNRPLDAVWNPDAQPEQWPDCGVIVWQDAGTVRFEVTGTSGSRVQAGFRPT